MKRFLRYITVLLLICPVPFSSEPLIAATRPGEEEVPNEQNLAIIAKTAEYQSALVNLFTDFSFSELKSDISIDNLDNNADYQKLSDAPDLQMMVKKIAGKDWREVNVMPDRQIDWADEYARKYRVQLYEPYSESVPASALVGVSNYTNMNNPSGIVADKGNLVYVMVEDDAPTGSTLYINEVHDPAAMYNGTQDGIKLHKGLNIFECKNDTSHFFIYYSVQTVKQVNGKYVANEDNNLKRFKPIKIHIEGGRINGFFNYAGDSLYGKDTQEEFDYTIQRATHPMFNLIGERVILHFHLEDTPSTVGGTQLYPGVKSVLFSNKKMEDGREHDPVKILTAWDEMCLTERVLMGLQSDDDINLAYNQNLYESNFGDHVVSDGTNSFASGSPVHYNEYFNNKLFGMSRQGDGLFMSAGDWRTSYNVYTIEAVLTLFNRGDIWGPAHEYGHMNQRLINLAGTTEESNNIFSNVVVFYQGNTTSRSDFISTQFKIFQEGKPFLEHDTWGTTRMFWQLWCYYHATGHNKKFYPRLFELLRKYPITKTIRPGEHNERYDKLHFAKMCCIAAEEDLTDFFTAWGFFVPLELYSFTDYQTYDTFLTEEDIQAVKEEIAAFDFKKNDAIIFIDDRVGSLKNSYSGFNKEDAGDFGGLDAFREGRAPKGSFGFSIDINTVNIVTEGDPGAGFIIKDHEGNLLGFSNSKTFTVNDELADKLRNGEAIMTAVGADNTTSEVANLLAQGTLEDKLAILDNMLKIAKDLTAHVDPSNTKVGFLKPGSEAELKGLIDDIENKLATGNIESAEITRCILELTDSYNNLTANEDAFIPLETGSLYMLTNSARRQNYPLSYNSSGICTTVGMPANPGAPSSANIQWNFEPTLDDGIYYIQNWETKAYIHKAQGGNIPLYYNTGYKYNVKSAREKNNNIGLFLMVPYDDMNLAIHVGGNLSVVGYYSDAGASRWYITKVVNEEDVDTSDDYRVMLENLIKQYEELKIGIDPENAIVGYLKPESADIFEENSNEIAEVVADRKLSEKELANYYNSFLQKYRSLIKGIDNLRITIEPGAAYLLQNLYQDSGTSLRYLSAEGSYVYTNPVSSAESFSRQWVFEASSNVPGLYAIRNMNASGDTKYISARGDAKNRIPLTGDPVYFKLMPIEHSIGVFGVSRNGNLANSLITNMLEAPNEAGVISRMAMYSFITGDEGKWIIKKVHDSEYVDYRDRLVELSGEVSDVLFSEIGWTLLSVEDWMRIYSLTDEAAYGTGPLKNSSTTLEELKDWVAKFEGAKAYIQAVVDKKQILTVKSIGKDNDGEDKNLSLTEGLVRHAFNISESICFDGLIALENPENLSNMTVRVEPVGNGQWKTSSASSKAALLEDYRREFTRSAPEATLFEQLQSLNCEYIDGFYTGVKAEMVQNKSGDFNLLFYAPCSGRFEVILEGKEGYAAFLPDMKIPSFTVDIYPNLKGVFNNDKGININGYTFVEDSEHEKTICLPLEYVKDMDLTECTVYIPGLYFADDFSVETTSSRRMVNTISEASATAVNSAEAGASKYYAHVDLSSLKEENNSKETLNVAVSKNGATANYVFYVTKGDTYNVSTEVEDTMVDEGETIYYDLQGIRVDNPRHGIYIRKTGNKTEKIVL